MLWSSSPKTMPVTEARLDGSDGAVEARQGEGMPPTPQAQQEPREQEMPPAQPCGPERADSVQQLGSGVGFSTDLPRPAGGRRASLRTSLEERATMERASSSSLKHRKPGMMTKATAMMSKKSLFDTVDNDGSGTIDSNEFSDLYNVVAEQTRAEMQKEQALKKKSKIMVAVASAMALFLALSVTTNFLVVFTVVDAQVKTTTDGEGVLVDKAGNQTVITQTQRPKGQTGIPLGLATFMNHDELMGIEKIMLTRYSPAEDYAVNFSGATFFDTRSVNDTQNLTGTYFKVTYMITGYEWFSEASMKFATSEGVHIWIVQGNAWALDDASPVPTQICSTDMECARFRVEGIDVDAVIARAELHAQGNHSESVRRALAQSGGECTDPTMLQERILAHLAQDQATLDAMTAAADIIEVESQSNSTLGKALRRMRRQMGEGPPQQSFTGVFDAWRAARDNEDPEVRSRRLEAVAQNRRRMTHSAAHASSSGGNANFGTSTIGNYILKHSWNALAEGVSAAAASTIPASGTSVECQTTDGKLQAFYTNVQTFRDAQDDLDGVCTELISASDTITQIKTDMETVESNLNTAKNLANVLKPLPYIGGVMGTVSTQCNNLKNNVQSKRIAFQSSSLYLGAQRVKAHAEDVQDKNAAASTKIDLAKESFQKYVENPVKVVDAYCSHYTKDYVCTDPVNDAIDTMNALFDQTLPDFGPIISPWSVFANWLNSFNPFLNLILGLSGILAPFNVIFNTQHCIPQACVGCNCNWPGCGCVGRKWWRVCACGPYIPRVCTPSFCFTLGNVVNAFSALVGMVQGLIMDALAALGLDLNAMVASLIPSFPSFPSFPNFLTIALPAWPWPSGFAFPSPMIIPCFGELVADGSFAFAWNQCPCPTAPPSPPAVTYDSPPPPSPKPPPASSSSICYNYCTGKPWWGSDGYCDDGGPGAEYSGCSFGTDCEDCGPRSG